MGDRPCAVRLNGTDAITVLRLLESFERLLRSETLGDRHRETLLDAAMIHEDWQPRLVEQVAATTGLIRQQLDGYDVDAVIAGATVGAR